MEQKIFITNKSKLKLASIIHKPRTQGFFPSVILLHGFTGYKEEEHIVGIAKDLASNGFIAIRFDASGFGESEGTTEKDFRFSNYLNDVRDVYEFLCNQTYVNKEKVFLWGHSMGAMLSIIFAAEEPKIKALAAVSPPIKMATTDWLGSILPEWRKTGWFEKESSRGAKMRIPYDFIEDAQKYDCLEYTKKVHQPILIVLGKEDDVVSPKDTKAIFDVANEPKELFEVEGMDHEYKYHPNLIKIVDNKVIEFFKRYE